MSQNNEIIPEWEKDEISWEMGLYAQGKPEVGNRGTFREIGTLAGLTIQRNENDDKRNKECKEYGKKKDTRAIRL